MNTIEIGFQISGTSVIHDTAFVYFCPRMGEFVRLNDGLYMVTDVSHNIPKGEITVIIKLANA